MRETQKISFLEKSPAYTHTHTHSVANLGFFLNNKLLEGCGGISLLFFDDVKL